MNANNYEESSGRRRQQCLQTAAMMNSSITDAVIVVAAFDDEPPRHRRPNEPRQREPMGQNLLEDYFVERPIFDEQDFRQRFQMSMHLFNQIKTKLCNHDPFWNQKADVTRLQGLLPEQKMTGALRMLAYSAASDQCIEYTKMGESTTLECMKKWCAQVLYEDRYLRAPNVTDITRLLRKVRQRRFPGMIRSIDCMHWEGKNCPTAWKRSYSGRNARPTIILEATASYDRWIWHSFFGTPGAQNDGNVLNSSDVFDELLAERSSQSTYNVNGMTYHHTYYLADRIYLRYSSFVKTISHPQNQPQKLFERKQEAYRKDVEKYFGMLQSHWAIIRHSVMSSHIDIENDHVGLHHNA